MSLSECLYPIVVIPAPPRPLGDKRELLVHQESIVIGDNKGLTNRPGENNCFLNSAIQVSKNHKWVCPEVGVFQGLKCLHVTV